MCGLQGFFNMGSELVEAVVKMSIVKKKVSEASADF
jgi:hypothetical protein